MHQEHDISIFCAFWDSLDYWFNLWKLSFQIYWLPGNNQGTKHFRNLIWEWYENSINKDQLLLPSSTSIIKAIKHLQVEADFHSHYQRILIQPLFLPFFSSAAVFFPSYPFGRSRLLKLWRHILFGSTLSALPPTNKWNGSMNLVWACSNLCYIALEC